MDLFDAPNPGPSAVTVSALLARAKQALDRALPLCWVVGEISGLKRAASGHCYFDLKDSDAQIACVLYRNRAALVGFELRDGAQVELRVRPSIYEPRGSLQFTVEQARLAGVGRLYEAFLALKAKLTAEGLFDEDRKRALPQFPRHIGLITSPQAAALADMLRVLRDRWPLATITLYPSSVQGVNAPRELLNALQTANRRAECDVLIIGRGGGSLEDLWAFNDEALTRAVASSALPIVSAVGHETDFSLTDFAADLRAPTPTAAAALITPERDAVLHHLELRATRMERSLRHRLERAEQRLDRASDALRHSSRLLAPWRERLLRLQTRLQGHARSLVPRQRERFNLLGFQLSRLAQKPQPAAANLLNLNERLSTAMHWQLQDKQRRLTQAAQALKLLNPQQVLDRGYAVVFDPQGKTLTDVAQGKVGSTLQIRLKRGSLNALVTAQHATADDDATDSSDDDNRGDTNPTAVKDTQKKPPPTNEQLF